MPTPTVFSLRLQPNAKEKVRALANKDKRSINKQLEYIVNEYIETYEKEHGPIAVTKELPQ